jgi:hypothetical protein
MEPEHLEAEFIVPLDQTERRSAMTKAYTPHQHAVVSPQPQIRVGDFFEDCKQHPVFCTECAPDLVHGISLFDGSKGPGCSIHHCRPRKMTVEEVGVRIKNRERWLAARSAFSADPATRQLVSDLLAEEAAVIGQSSDQ